MSEFFSWPKTVGGLLTLAAACVALPVSLYTLVQANLPWWLGVPLAVVLGLAVGTALRTVYKKRVQVRRRDIDRLVLEVEAKARENKRLQEINDTLLEQIDMVKAELRAAEDDDHVFQWALQKWLNVSEATFEVCHVARGLVSVSMLGGNLNDAVVSNLEGVRFEIQARANAPSRFGHVVGRNEVGLLVQIEGSADGIEEGNLVRPIAPLGASDVSRRLGLILYRLQYELVPARALLVSGSAQVAPVSDLSIQTAGEGETSSPTVIRERHQGS